MEGYKAVPVYTYKTAPVSVKPNEANLSSLILSIGVWQHTLYHDEQSQRKVKDSTSVSIEYKIKILFYVS